MEYLERKTNGIFRIGRYVWSCNEIGKLGWPFHEVPDFSCIDILCKAKEGCSE